MNDWERWVQIKEITPRMLPKCHVDKDANTQTDHCCNGDGVHGNSLPMLQSLKFGSERLKGKVYGMLGDEGKDKCPQRW